MERIKKLNPVENEDLSRFAKWLVGNEHSPEFYLKMIEIILTAKLSGHIKADLTRLKDESPDFRFW